MKTAIQQLIEKKQQKLDSLRGNPYPSIKVKVQISCIIHDLQMLEKMLPIEKQQIVDARVTPPLLHDLQKEGYIKEAENYYKTTFNK